MADSRTRRRAPPPSTVFVGLFALVTLFGGWPQAQGLVLHAVEHRPSYRNVTIGTNRTLMPWAPVDLRQQRLSSAGEDPLTDSSVKMSRFQYIGCFQHPLSITVSAIFGYYRDPNECIAECKSQDIYANTPSSELVVAVHNDPFQGRCGCALKSQFSDFVEAADETVSCTYRCKNYLNPYCGGFPDWWGVYIEYDQRSMSAQGAYDPWRYVWYILVTITERSVIGRYPEEGVNPERYYLNAVDTVSGQGAFQFQTRIKGGILYGIQYDIDSTRLVALYTDDQIGRMRVDLEWTYKLAIIYINTTNKFRPYMQLNLAPLEITEPRAAVSAGSLVSPFYMAYSGASAIMSKDTNVYIFTQAQWAANKPQMKDRVYVVRIPDGLIIREEPLDFKVTSLFSNQMYGDLSAIGPRNDPQSGVGKQTYTYLARIYRNKIDSAGGAASITLVDWQYNPINPPLLASLKDIGDWQLYPALEASEHLFNSTAIAFRYKTPAHPWGVFTIAEVNIRKYLLQLWCDTNTTCQGTLDYDIPYAGIFNREPGIPLTLKAPSFIIPARFNMDASAIIVKFDRSTLQGARQIDINGDFLPDEIDYSLQRDGFFDCGELFSLETTYKLGPWRGTQCEWKSNSEVRINIAYVNISVGDSIFILSDALYAVNVDNQWSPAATGGVQIGLPDPLESPVIVPSGSQEIDQCTPVTLKVDSELDGGLAFWKWEWVPSVEGAPNPYDMANRKNFTFDPIKLRAITDYLAQATAANNLTLDVPAQLFEEASGYNFSVSVTSRWNLTTSHVFALKKLAFPAPTVFIEGPLIIWKNRTQNLQLIAVGKPSRCADANTVLAYRWLVTGQKEAPLGIPLVLSDYPDIIPTSNVLNLPPYILEPSPEKEYNEYNFTVQCYVNTQFGDVAERTAQATVTVRVRKSSVLVRMSVYDRLLTISDILLLDARSSIDPDYPQSEGLTFSGNFEYRCLTPEPERAPCFNVRRLGADGKHFMTDDGFVRVTGPPSQALGIPSQALGMATGRALAESSRRLQATSGFLTSANMRSCRQDIGTLLHDGGNTYFYPLFDGINFCEYARGVLMVQTQDFPPGKYKWTVRAIHFDGRRAELDLFIELVMQRVPRIVLSFEKEPASGKFPVTSEIRIRGVEEGEASDTRRTYTWQVFAYERNPAYSQEAAQAALNDPDNPYTIDEFIFSDKTGTTYIIEDPTQFEASLDSPNIVIKKGTLRPSTKFKIRLNINLASVTGYSEINVETAGLAPRNGRLEVDPMVGSFSTRRVLNAPDWNADDSPLTYLFGYYAYSAGSTDPTLQSLSAAPSQVKSLSVKSLPLGTKDETTGNYTIPLFVEVCTPFGACTVSSQVVVSNPPSDLNAAVGDLLSGTTDQTPAEQLNTYGSVLSVAGNNLTVQGAVLDGLEQTPLSGDAAEAARRAALLDTMVANGANSNINIAERVMGALEGLVISSADNNLFNANQAIADSAFSAMGGLMPGAVSTGGLTATGQSTLMGTNRAPSALNQGVVLGTSGTSSSTSPITSTDNVIRQRVNHAVPTSPLMFIEDCPTDFCDLPGLWCITGQITATIKTFRCCTSRNFDTLCDDPPCWFKGSTCPSTSTSSSGSGLSSGRRLVGETEDGKKTRKGAVAARRITAKGPPGIKHQTITKPSATDFAADGNDMPQPTPQLVRGQTWFDSWVGYNFPLGAPDESEVSEYNRVRGFHGWHPDLNARRLEFMSVNESMSAAARLRALEDAEAPLVRMAQAAVANSELMQLTAIRSAAEEQLAVAEMPKAISQRLKAEAAYEQKAAMDYQLEVDRNSSQRITRIIVMRDTIAKSLISGMIPNERPKTFLSITFRLTIGKTPDLTKVHPHFEFPAPYFKRPADSPDEPTPLRPLTGFAYIYVEYFSNVYAWSKSTPLSNESAMVTLIALQANTKDLEVHTIDPPIKVFKQFDLYSNAKCWFWDRFAANSAGGKWSSQGVVNDGDCCLVSHIADVGVFMDGTMPTGSEIVDVASSWDREVWVSKCIGCDSGSKWFAVTVLAMLLFTLLLLVLLGYVQDERRRNDMKKNKVKSRYYYDGDGLTSALHVDDPIAYGMRDTNLMWFWIGTFVNVCVREHALFGSVFYHETFTRPQRLICLMAMICGLLAVNAAIHSNPGYVQQAREWVISGVLSGLLVFPVYCGLVLIFNMRPAQVKKRLIKRTYSTRELDLINSQRQKLADQTSLLPPASYMHRPLAPPGSIVGNTSLLALPAPLPLPPLPPGGVGRPGQFMALPPPPPGMMGGYDASGMLALPALPGMTANLPLPPPPKYPPPPGNAKMPSPAAMMPPLNWPKVGQPPPAPFPALMAPEASMGGSYTNLPVIGSRMPLTPPDTGATPLQFLDHHAAAGVGMISDHEATSPVQMMLKEDMSHGMAPPMNLPGAMPEPHGAQGAMRPIPATPKTPPLPIGHMMGGSSPSASFRGSEMSAAPLLPYDAVPPPIFVRGGPPPMLPPPHSAAPRGPGGIVPFVPPGMPPPNFLPPVPSAFQGGLTGFAGAPLPPGLPPAPPPPPREDDGAFVRRIKLTYMDKVTREHDKYDLLQDHEELGKDIPFWVFDTMTVMPYLAACSFSLVCIFVVLQYGVKFESWQEDAWIQGSVVGLFMNLVLLELFRIIMMTLVEMRKFENRRKAKAGAFMPRRVKRAGEDFQSAPPPRLWKRAMVPPAVPKGKAPPQRPHFLPPSSGHLPPPPPRPPGMPGMAGLPGPPPAALGPGTGPRIPVAPPRPPIFSAAAMARAGGFEEPPIPGTPHSMTSGFGRTGASTPPMGTPTHAGHRGPPPGPRLQSAHEIASGSNPPTPGRVTPGRGAPPSPTHSTHSLSGLAYSLNQQVKAGRHAEAPPPPPAHPGAVPVQGTPPPPAPAAPPPSYSRPPSRHSTTAGAPKQPPPRR